MSTLASARRTSASAGLVLVRAPSISLASVIASRRVQCAVYTPSGAAANYTPASAAAMYTPMGAAAIHSPAPSDNPQFASSLPALPAYSDCGLDCGGLRAGVRTEGFAVGGEEGVVFMMRVGWR